MNAWALPAYKQKSQICVGPILDSALGTVPIRIVKGIGTVGNRRKNGHNSNSLQRVVSYLLVSNIVVSKFKHYYFNISTNTLGKL